MTVKNAWNIIAGPIRLWWATFCDEAWRDALPETPEPHISFNGRMIANGLTRTDDPVSLTPTEAPKKALRPFRMRRSQSDLAASWEYRQSNEFKRLEAARQRQKEGLPPWG
jgi:hypothetical protein